MLSQLADILVGCFQENLARAISARPRRCENGQIGLPKGVNFLLVLKGHPFADLRDVVKVVLRGRILEVPVVGVGFGLHIQNLGRRAGLACKEAAFTERKLL